MLSLILIIIILCVAAGIIGFVIKGLFWLFIIAAVVFIITVLSSFFGAGHSHGRRRTEGKLPPTDETEE